MYTLYFIIIRTEVRMLYFVVINDGTNSMHGLRKIKHTRQIVFPFNACFHFRILDRPEIVGQ